jgi:HSP20 family molecular chaperone IbpA
MSSIKNTEKVTAQQIENLKRRQSREISQLKSAHEDYKTDLKKTGELEVIELQNEHQRQIAEESLKKEKVLTQMKEHLQHTRQMTDKELRTLTENTTNVREREHKRLAEHREKIQSENELYLDELNHRFATQTKKINHQGQEQIEGIKEVKVRELNGLEDQFQQKVTHQNHEFTTRIKTDAANYERLKDAQTRQFKHERINTNNRQQVEMAKLTTAHQSQIETKDQEFRKEIKEQDKFLEKKYQSTLASRSEELKRLEDKHEKVIAEMKKGLKEQLTVAVSRSDDPFYQFTELRPKLTQHPKHVVISVEIPEYAKQDLQLTLNNKEAIVNFNRRYSDSQKTENGLSKINKVETFSTRLMTEASLDPKSVKSTYEDGVMTYTIQKS